MQMDDLGDRPPAPPRDRLDSWKEIAAYLNCSERTVRRWEEEGLPVHRHPHKKKPAIYAYKVEVDAWWRNGHERLANQEPAHAARRRRWALLLAAGLVSAIAASVVGVSLLRRSGNPASRVDYVQLTDFPDSVTQPALSPDGRMLAFVRGPSTFVAPGEIYIKMLPSGEPIQLTHDNLAKMSPVFSPDGSHIAYTALTGSSWDTWVVPTLGGQPHLWLPNASGLVWTPSQHLMFSEIKSGEHMAIVSSLESRAESRDIYVPPHERGMAHNSYLSPSGKLVLLTEMDNAQWLPCRVVPFNGESAGKSVGPPAAPCTNGAWSPDGSWIYLSVRTEDHFHIWRQHFPDGKPEQITSGPTEHEGITISPDGRSFITSVGVRPRTVFLHGPSGDRRISQEGYAYFPTISPDGKRIYYRVLKGGGGPFLATSELWVTDLESGRGELLLPGFAVTGYSISQDGRRVVFSALGSDGKPRLWMASTDRSDTPRQIANIVGDMPYFGPVGELVFHAVEGNSNFAYLLREDGTNKRRTTEKDIQELYGTSPDDKFVIAKGGINGQLISGACVAVPIDGGPLVPIFDGLCVLRWDPNRKFVYLSVYTAQLSAGAAGRTYVLPVLPGKVFPHLPTDGFHSEKEIAAFPGVRVIEAADVWPGSSPDVYAFSRQDVYRNLYKIQLP